MDNIDQLLKDFYSKYGTEPLDDTKLGKIKSLYGNNYDKLLTDLYSKYNQPLDNNKIKLIKDTYKLNSSIVDNGPINQLIGTLESNNDYKAKNDIYMPKLGRTSKATGKYQHIWDLHKNTIKDLTGITNRDQYLNSPEAQEIVQESLNKTYIDNLPELRDLAAKNGLNFSDEELIYINHHSGIGGAKKYLRGERVTDHDGLEGRLTYARDTGLSSAVTATQEPKQTREEQLNKVKADAKEEAAGLKGLVSWGTSTLTKLGSLITGAQPNALGAVSKLMSDTRDVDKNYKKSIEKQFINGNLSLENTTDEELLSLHDDKTLVEDLKKRSDKSKKELDKQLKDEGLFEGLGDILAPQLLDKFVGGISGKSETRLNTKDGRVDISSKLNLPFSSSSPVVTELFLDPKDILKLEYHPLAKSKDPNDPFNKSLRQVQKILTTPESLEFQALAKPTNLRLDISTKQIKDIEGKIIKSMGKPVLDKFYELNEKISQEQATPEEQEELQTILQEMQSKNIPLDQLSNTFKHRAETLQKLEDTKNKFGQLQKVENLKSLDSKNADDIDRSLTAMTRPLTSISNILDNTLNTVVGGIPDAIGAVGVMAEGVTGVDVGFTDAAKRKADNQVEIVKSTNKTKGATSYDMINVDGYRAVWTQEGDPLIYDKDGYLVRNESEVKRVTRLANEKLKKDYNNDYKELGLTYNGLSTWDGIEDTIPQLAGIFAFGGLAKAGGMALSGKILARGSRNGLVANTLNTMATSGKLTSSIGTIPTFAGDFMVEAIKDGATTPGQIGLTTAVKLAQEAIAESIFEGPIGRALSAKGISKAAFRETFMDQVTNSLRHFGTNRSLVTKDLLLHSRNVLGTFVKDTLGEGFEEFIVEATTPDLNGTLNSLVGTKYDTNKASAADLLNATLVGMGAGALMGGGSVIRSMANARAEINDAYDQELSEVIAKSTSALMKNETILSPEAFKEHTRPLVEKGLVTEEYANKYYSAVKEAATRTKFLDEIDTSSTFFNDNDIDAKEKFMNFTRSLAYDKAMISKEESDNSIQRAKDSVKVSQYDTILKQLETNSYAGLYTATTPFRIGTDKSINLSPEAQAKLGSSQEAILEEVNKTKFNQDNKVKYYNLLLHKKALELKKLDDKTTEKEKEKVDPKVEVVNKEIEKVKAEDTKVKAKEAVKTNTATPEQLKTVSSLEQEAVNDWFNLYEKELKDGSISPDALQQLLENNTTQLDNINKRLKVLDLEKYTQQAEKLSKQESNAKSTAKAGFFGRYNDKPELYDAEHQTFTNSFEEYLKEKLNTLDPSSLFYQQELNEINTLIDEVSNPDSAFNNSTFEEKYNSYPFFKELVDQATTDVKKPANYTEPKKKPVTKKETKKEPVKKEDLKDTQKSGSDIEAKKADIERRRREGTNARGTTYKGETTEKDGIKVTKYFEFGPDGKRISKGGRIMTPSKFIKEYNITNQDYLESLEGATEIRIYEVRVGKNNTVISIQGTFPEGYIDMEIVGAEVTTNTQSDIEAKKADIERRRQGLNGVEEIIFNNPNFRLEGFEIDGNYWNVVTSTDRAKVLVNINGVIVPFYLTTGQAGKGLVPGWYPFFGIGKDGWLNKTDKSDMETYYERYWGKETADIVKSISEELNSFYGTDPSTFKNDGDPNATSRPLSTLADKVEDYINSKLSYTPAMNNADARKTLRSNVEQLGKEINAKYDAELKALEQPVLEKEPEKPGTGVTRSQGKLNISVDGYNAISIADNKLINSNLLKGDSIYYRIGQRNGKDIIESVLYFKNGKFVSKEDGGREILAGQLNITNKTIVLADRIKGSKDGFVKGVVSQSPYYNKGYNKKQNADVNNKSKLTSEEIAALRPNMYVIGQDYQSNNLLVLFNKETDGESSMSIEDFIDNYLERNPKYKSQRNSLKAVLSNNTPNYLNGKTFVLHNGEIVLFDVLPNKDVPENAERIRQKVEELSTSSKYKQKEDDAVNADGYVQASTIDLIDIVAKRDESLDDSKNSGIPNVHGKLIEFFAAGKKAIGEQIANDEEIKPLYKLSRTEGDQELSKKYLTKEQVIKELLDIRANIDHDTLRGTDTEYNDYLSKVIEVPYGIENGRAIFYNVINTIIEESDSKVEAEIPVVSEEKSKPENKEQLDITPDNESITKSDVKPDILEDDSNIDFKVSDKNYAGKVEEAVLHIKSRFEEIAVEVDDIVLQNLVKGTAIEGSKVWGAFHNAMITLSSMAGEKIAKHEEIHLAEIMFHTPDQIQAFRREALEKYGKELGISKTKVEDLTPEELKEIREALATEFEDYKNTLLFPEGFSKKYPIISKFIEKLFNFLKKNYIIGRSYITNKKSIDQLFYEVENNILGRDLIGRRKKSTRYIFEKALNNLSKPDFKVSNWDTKTTYNFADFIVKDLFSNYLYNMYNVKSLSEVLAKYNKVTAKSVFNDFKSNLKNIIDDYKNDVIDRKKLTPDSDAYNSFVSVMNDIFEQAAGENKNKNFEDIIDKKLEQRAYAGSTLAALEKDEDVDNLNESETEFKDDEEDSTRESWQVKLGKIDAKTKSSVRLREFFASLPKAARIVKDGKSTRSTISSTTTFNTLHYDGQYIHNKLLVELSDNSNYEDFINAINSLVPKYQFAGDIIAKILNLSEQELMEAYDNNTLALPLDIFTNTEKHDDYNMWLLKDMYQAIGDQTNQNPLKTLTSLKGKKVISSQVVNSIKETDLKNAKRTILDKLDEVAKDDIKKQDLIDKINLLVDKIENNKPVSSSIKEVFSALGYGATEELLLHLQPSVFMDGELNNLIELKLAVNGISRDLKDNKNFDEADSKISKLARLISTYSTVSSGLSYLNVENENEYSHRNSSYLSRINAIWLKGLKNKSILKDWIKDMTTYTEVVNGEEITYNILGQFRNPAYKDLVNDRYKYRFFEDGFIQVEGQSNNGKVYSDYTPDEVLSSSINLFLGKNNEAKEDNTIKKKDRDLEHALFHIGVNSDAGQRNILHAPVFALSSISQKLSEMIYGEIERIFYVKAGQTKDYKNLKITGEFFQHIPELNNVRFKMADGSKRTFAEVFTATNSNGTELLWKDMNKNTNLPKISSMAMINKLDGKYGEVPITAITYDGVLQEVIKRVLANNASNFMDVIQKKGFFDNEKSPIALASTSDIESYYYNSFYNNIVISNMLVGDPANYKKNKKNNKTDIEWFKRFKQLISPGIRKAFSRENFSVLIIKDIEIKSNIFKGVDASITDAQGLHTLKRRLEIMKADADWDLKKDEIEGLVERINNGTYTKDDLASSYFQILKPFAFDMVTRKLPATAPDGSPSSLAVKVPVQLKDSEAVLLPTEAYAVKDQEIYVRPTSLQDIEEGKYLRPELAKLLYLMETQDVDTAIFTTGSKVEQFNVIDINTADENIVKESKFDFKNANWTEQQINTRKDFNSEVNDGSQVRKIMTANVDENWTFNLDGVDYKGQQGANELLMEIERVNALENKNKISKKIKKVDGSADVDKALNIIKEGIIEKASDIETLEGMELLSDGKTLLPIELLGKKAQQVLNSIYKKIGKFKVKGAALINKSSFGYTREDQKLEYVDDLQLVMGTDKDGNQIIKYWEAIVPVYDAVIFNYIDTNGNLLLDKKGNPLIPEKLLTAFFYRIPTEDKYSMFPIRIKKFSMPAQGGNIILPREATIIAGLDFDIDKLYGYYYNFTEQFPPSIQEYTINKFSKENEVPKKILKNFITFAENNTSSNKEDIQEVFPEHFTFYDSFYKMLTSPDTKQVVDSINNKKEYNQFDDHHKIQVTNSSLSSPTGRQNLKLDAYMSLAQTPAFAKSVLNTGNKDRLIALRDKKAASIRDMNYSYADPVNLSENATKNIVGKRLIGIFANMNAFYNMIQGVAKIRLKYPYKIVINGTSYEFDSIGDVNDMISRNITELSFASTEDVKDPVLEALNINEITAGLLITLLSMTNKNGTEIMKFEDAIEVLSDPSIITAVKEVQSTGKRFDDVYKGQYRQLVEISSAYNDIVSAAKVDAQIGPDFYVVESKLEKIDNILTKGIKRKNYPFVGGDVLNILPSGSNNSRIKQLNVYREALDDEISTFEDLFSFLKPSIRNVVAGIRSVAKGNRLSPELIQKYSYYAYDAAIQNYLNSIGELQKLKTEFPVKLSTYTFPAGTEILQSAFEIKKGVVKTRWVNMSASDILTQQKNAFATLFIKDPKMASELASYAFLTGTDFTMTSIVKIVPNDFYFTDNGKVIRDIINGTKIQEYLPYGEKSHMPILYNHFESITNKLEVNDKGELEIDAIELLTEPYYHVKGSKDQPNKLYARTAMGFTLVYTKPKEALPNYIVEPIDVTNIPAENSDTTMESDLSNYIYSNLGNKTQSENVVIDEVKGRKPAVESKELLVVEIKEIPKKEGESFEEMQRRSIQNLNIKKRIEIATKNNITQGKDYSFNDIKNLFKDKNLFDNDIYNQLEKVLSSNLTFKFGSLNTGKKIYNAYYDSNNNSIKIDVLALQTSDFKRILLHEIIHATTFINLGENVKLTNTQKVALNNLNNVIEELKKDRDFFGQYGLTNANELLAELANDKFVDKLKNKKFDTNQNFFEKIISEIVKLLGLNTSAYDIVKESFDNLVSEYQQNQSSKPIVAYRTRGNNFLEALEKDNAIGNPWSHLGSGQVQSIFKIKISNTLEQFLEPFFNSQDENIVEPFAEKLTKEDKEILAKAIGRNYKDISTFDWYDAIWSDVGQEEVYYFLKTGNNLEKTIKDNLLNSKIYEKYKDFITENKSFVENFKNLPKEIQQEQQKDFNKLKEKESWFKQQIDEFEYNERKNLLKETGYTENNIQINQDTKNQYGLYKTNTVKEAVEEFIAWMTGEKHTDKLQDYRQAIINKIPEMKGNPILYYKDLGEPSHATALDYLINKYNWNNSENLDNEPPIDNEGLDTCKK